MLLQHLREVRAVTFVAPVLVRLEHMATQGRMRPAQARVGARQLSPGGAILFAVYRKPNIYYPRREGNRGPLGVFRRLFGLF